MFNQPLTYILHFCRKGIHVVKNVSKAKFKKNNKKTKKLPASQRINAIVCSAIFQANLSFPERILFSLLVMSTELQCFGFFDVFNVPIFYLFAFEKQQVAETFVCNQL